MARSLIRRGWWVAFGDARSADALLNFLRSEPTALVPARPSMFPIGARHTFRRRTIAIRVTFDRQLLGSPYEQGTDLLLPTQGARPNIGNGNQVILELKFTDRFPEWMHELTRLFGLQRTSVPKYILCFDALGFTLGMISHHRNGNHEINSGPCVSTQDRGPARDGYTTLASP